MAAGCADQPAPQAEPPNIVVFLVDTLRADRLGIYGYDRRPTSAKLDHFAAESVVFDNAYATSPWTLPTVASMATSGFSCAHGVVDDRRKLPAGMATMAEHLAEHGYLTMGLYGNAYAGPSFGLDRGFEHYTYSRRNNAEKVEPLLDLAATDGRPFLLYIHNMEPHGGERFQGEQPASFDPAVPKEFRETLLARFDAYRKLTRRDFARSQPLGTTDNTTEQQAELDYMDRHFEAHDVLYDGAIRLGDRRFGSVIDLLRTRGLLDNTVVVFLSDHGEELGEHGGWQHDQSVYEELIHIPLVIRLPAAANAGRRVDSIVTLVDVAPTLLALAGVPDPGTAHQGRDLGALMAGEAGSEEEGPIVVAVRDNKKKYFAPWKIERGDLNIALREDALKAIVNVEVGTVELYDLETDPGETDDLADRRPGEAARFADFAATWLARCGTGAEGATSDLDEATLDRLRALGYVD